MIISLVPEKVENQTFQKKGYLPPDKRFSPTFGSFYRVWQTSRDKFQWSNRFSDNYYGSLKIISVTPTMLFGSINFSKKDNFFSEKQEFRLFSPVLPSVTKPKGQLVWDQEVFSQLLWNL